MTYKVGEKVKIKNTGLKGRTHHYFNVGAIVTIKSNSEDGHWYCTDGTQNQHVHESSMTKITEKKMKAKVAPKKEVTTVLKAATKFDGYAVRTVVNNPNKVRFGCGQVVVDKKDLNALADALESPTEKAVIQKFLKDMETVGYWRYSISDIISNKNVMDLIQTVKKHKGVKALLNLKDAAGSRKHISDIAEIPVKRLRQLAMVTKPSNC